MCSLIVSLTAVSNIILAVHLFKNESLKHMRFLRVKHVLKILL